MVVTDEGVQRVCCLKQLSTLNLNMCVEVEQVLHILHTVRCTVIFLVRLQGKFEMTTLRSERVENTKHC